MSRAAGDPNWTDSACPVARALDLVGDRWSLLIVRDAMDDSSSFSDFQRRTGIARNILSDRLRKLVSRGILSRDSGPGRSHPEYALTEKGRDLFPVVLALRQWGERNAFTPGEPHSELVDMQDNPVPNLVPLSASGDPLNSDTTRVVKVAE